MSGWEVYYALLVPGEGSKLKNLLSEIKVANVSQYAFWTEPEIASSPIFVTASFVWEGSEAHYDYHLYKITSYLREPTQLADGVEYSSQDSYTTTKKYFIEKGENALISEQKEILSRLRKKQSVSRSPAR